MLMCLDFEIKSILILDLGIFFSFFFGGKYITYPIFICLFTSSMLLFEEVFMNDGIEYCGGLVVNVHVHEDWVVNWRFDFGGKYVFDTHFCFHVEGVLWRNVVTLNC